MANSRQLDQLINEVWESKLNAKIKVDALRVLECLRYNRENFYKVSGDKKNIVNDSHGVAFHIDSYADGFTALSQLLTQIEDTLTQLPRKRWLEFAEKIYYGDDVIHLNKCLTPALEWAKKALLNPILQLHDIMVACSRLRGSKDIHMVQFAEDYCKTRRIDRCLYAGEERDITPELLEEFSNKFLFEDEKSAQAESRKPEDEREFKEVTEVKKEIKEATEVKELKDEKAQHAALSFYPHHLTFVVYTFGSRVRYSFHDLTEAEKFVSILHQDPKLKLLDIHKVTPEKELCTLSGETDCYTDCYKVTITEKQFDSLYEKGSYQSLADISPNYREVSDPFATLSKASPAVASLAWCLMHRNENLMTDAITKLNFKNFVEVLKKVDKELIKQSAFSQCRDYEDGSYSTYHLPTFVVKHQSSEAFIMLLAIFGKDVINSISRSKGTTGYLLPMLVATYQNTEAFLQFLKMLDKDLIDNFSILQLYQGWTLPMGVANHQSPESFIALLNIINPDLLPEASFLSNIYGMSMIGVAAVKQSAPAFKLLLQRLHAHDKHKYLNKFITKHPESFLQLVKDVILFQSGENIQLFLELFTKDHIAQLQKIIKKFSQSLDERLVIFAAQDKLSGLVESKSECYSAIFKMIFSYSRRKPSHPPVQQTLNPDEQALLDIFDQGEAYIKIIRSDWEANWSDCTRQWKDLTYRPKLHAPHSRGCKLALGTKSILEERSDKEKIEHKKNKKKINAKKTSFTRVSKHKHTGIFGYHDATRELVGIVCAGLESKQIAARARQDFGSYDHKWVSSKRTNLMSYLRYMQNILFTDADEFDRCIDTQPGVCNEVLAKINVKNIRGIVIARDTPHAREIAIKRRNDFHAMFGIMLPICFYDPESKSVRIYHECEIYIEMLKQQIKAAKTTIMHRLFNSHIPINIPGFITSPISSGQADRILIRIREYERKPYQLNREVIIKKIFFGENIESKQELESSLRAKVPSL